MKKYLAVIAFFTIIGTTVNAQDLHLGIKGGLNAYTFGGDNTDDVKTKLGYNLGLLGHIHLSERFGLQPELVYSVQGATSDDASDTNINLGYVNVPVLFQYMYDNGFRLQAGPQLGFLTSAKAKGGDVTVDVKDAFKTVDLALSFGASYVNPSSGFGVDARYNYGLSNVNDGAGSEAFNRGFQIGIFYLFNHKS